MPIRKMLVTWLILLLLFLMSSCVATQTATTSSICPPEGYVLIKKNTLTDLMESCARTKSELNECLERERK